MHILSVQNALFHQVTACSLWGEVDHLGSTQLDVSLRWVQGRNASVFLKSVLKSDQLRNHKQVLHDTAVLIIPMNDNVVAFLVFQWHIDQSLILQSKELSLSVFNVLGKLFPLVSTNKNLFIKTLQRFHLGQQNSFKNWNRLWRKAWVVVVWKLDHLTDDLWTDERLNLGGEGYDETFSELPVDFQFHHLLHFNSGFLFPWWQLEFLEMLTEISDWQVKIIVQNRLNNLHAL